MDEETWNGDVVDFHGVVGYILFLHDTQRKGYILSILNKSESFDFLHVLIIKKLRYEKMFNADLANRYVVFRL